MNIRIFWVRVMKCMCAQTRPWFILSSKRVFGGMEFEPMLTPREKSPLPENFPRGGSNPRRCGQRAQTLRTSYSCPNDGKELNKTMSILFSFQQTQAHTQIAISSSQGKVQRNVSAECSRSWYHRKRADSSTSDFFSDFFLFLSFFFFWGGGGGGEGTSRR